MGKELDTPSLESALEEVDGYARSLDAEAERYWRLHRRRFAWVAAFARRALGGAESARVLDIGNSFQTVLLSKQFAHWKMDTLGFYDHRFPAGEGARHFAFDLNDAYDEARWPRARSDERYDLILFLEVLEHLYTAPEHVLRFLRSLMPPGGLLLIQTPNAAALKKRLKLLAGRNPYELIREDRGNPGHFRELTVADLRRYAKRAGFAVESVAMDAFLVDGKRLDRIFDRLAGWLPGGLRGGISMALRRSEASSSGA